MPIEGFITVDGRRYDIHHVVEGGKHRLDLMRGVHCVNGSLDCNVVASTFEAAKQELEAFFSWVCSPVWKSQGAVA